MSLIPVVWPDVPVLWHNAVVDIESTSQYGLDRDLTSVNSTLCYLNETGQPLAVSLLAPSHAETECNVRRQSLERPVHQQAVKLERGRYQPLLEALEAGGWGAEALARVLDCSPKHYVAEIVLEPGPQVVRFHTRLPIRADAQGVRELALAVPMGPGPRARGAPLSIVVLLPSDAPDYQVELLDWSREATPGAKVTVYGAQGQPRFGGRVAAAWSWVGDAFVWLKYRYVR